MPDRVNDKGIYSQAYVEELIFAFWFQANYPENLTNGKPDVFRFAKQVHEVLSHQERLVNREASQTGPISEPGDYCVKIRLVEKSEDIEIRLIHTNGKMVHVYGSSTEFTLEEFHAAYSSDWAWKPVDTRQMFNEIRPKSLPKNG